VLAILDAKLNPNLPVPISKFCNLTSTPLVIVLTVDKKLHTSNIVKSNTFSTGFVVVLSPSNPTSPENNTRSFTLYVKNRAKQRN
jgi:archaellum component FlaG (FlaF/FlaG flagellin family)